jgi:hypothetical protein
MSRQILARLTVRERWLFPVSAFIVFVAIGIFFYSLTYGDKNVGYLSDDAIYLLMAEIFSPWKHSTSLLFQYLRADNHFPPLYPVMLGLFGADSHSPVLASVITTAFLTIAVVVYGVWIYMESDRRTLAVALPVLFALLPGTIIFTQGLWSEFLFMCFFYGALALVSDKTLTGSHWLACSLFFAVTALTRAVGISLIAAFCLYLVLKRPRHYILYMLVAALPFLYWAFFINIHATDHGYFGMLLNSFTSGQVHAAGLFHNIIAKLVGIYDGWLWQFLIYDIHGGAGVVTHISLAILLVIALSGLGHRLIHGRLDALCLVFYGITVLLWPFSDLNFVSRFVFPVTPLMLYYVFYAIGLIRDNAWYRKAITLVVSVSIIFSIWPSTSYLFNRAYAAIPPQLAPYRHDRAWFYSKDLDSAIASAKGSRDIFHALNKVATMVPSNECIFSFHTGLVILYTHRMSGVYPLPSASDEEFAYGTRGCRWMVALPLTSINNNFPKFYPMRRIVNNPAYTIFPILPDDAEQGSQPTLFLIRRNTTGRIQPPHTQP